MMRTSKGPITVEIMLHCLLRWLGGGSYLDIRLCIGISPTSFYRCIHKCIDAILNSDELSYKFPSTTAEFEAAAQEFEALRSHGVIKGCVACLDGLLLRIHVPASSKTGNLKAYFWVTTKHMESMYRLPVITNVDLCTLALPHQAEIMTSQH